MQGSSLKPSSIKVLPVALLPQYGTLPYSPETLPLFLDLGKHASAGMLANGDMLAQWRLACLCHLRDCAVCTLAVEICMQQWCAAVAP